jgi:tRNA (adenine57-N1/adenine58-N1)-methyltransferase
MIAHTGFLLTARRLAPGAVLPELKRRPSKTEFSDEDVEAWTPGALGERSVSAKSLRKRVRLAGTAASLARESTADDAPDEPTGEAR